MEDSKWRVAARCIAIVQLVSLFTLLMTLFLSALFLTTGIIRPSVLPGFFEELIRSATATKISISIEDKRYLIPGIWILAILFFQMTMILMWAAFKLLEATELSADPYEALDKARIWKDVALIFFTPSYFAYIFVLISIVMFSPNLTGLVILGIVSIGILLLSGTVDIVTKFIEKLKQVAGETKNEIECV